MQGYKLTALHTINPSSGRFPDRYSITWAAEAPFVIAADLLWDFYRKIHSDESS